MCTAAGRPATELNQKKRLTTANPRAAAGSEPAGLAAGGRAALGFRRGTNQAKTIKSQFSLGWAPPPPPVRGLRLPAGVSTAPPVPEIPLTSQGKELWVPRPCAVPCPSPTRLTGERPLDSSDRSRPLRLT